MFPVGVLRTKSRSSLIVIGFVFVLLIGIKKQETNTQAHPRSLMVDVSSRQQRETKESYTESFLQGLTTESAGEKSKKKTRQFTL
jgi:hypothetical protein